MTQLDHYPRPRAVNVVSTGAKGRALLILTSMGDAEYLPLDKENIYRLLKALASAAVEIEGER